VGKPRIRDWIDVIDSIKHPERKARIAIVGKYMKIQDAYKSIYESLAHAGIHHKTKVELVRIEAEDLEKRGALDRLEGVHGILVPGGFGERGTEGKINAIQYAREKHIPYYGLCLGMQLAVVEFGRHVCGMSDVTSTEFKAGCQNPVIDLMPDQANVSGKGGTMRLGSYPCVLGDGSKAALAYGKKQVDERHRHRYEFNNKYREVYEHRGMNFSGLSPDGRLVEIIELADHPWFVAVQFHPEFKSTPTAPHPLFRDFVGAALAYAKKEGVDTRTEHGQEMKIKK
jgi:CTP synthase